jgi:hypothetical protein
LCEKREEFAMAESKTKVTSVKPEDFIAAIENDTRRADALTLLQLFGKVTGWNAKMWGPTIIGFGAYHYTYDSGRTGSICAIGFSPRKANQVIYVADFPGKEALLQQLGKHKGGLEQCLYINKLTDVDLAVLTKILKGGLAEIKKTWPVTAS